MNQLLIFAKAPRPGLVKTRLAHTLGQDEASRACQHLLHALSRNLAPLPRVSVCFSPADAAAELRPFFPPHWHFRPQIGPDLGARLHHAIATSFAEGATRVAVIGSDCPYITTADVENAWQTLHHHDLVFGPAHDGGYWLVGLNQPQPQIFRDIQWSTSTVLEQSLSRAEELNLQSALLRELSDIDTEPDWRAFLATQP